MSLVVLARDNLELTRACVASLRANTDVSSELIIVDNGSAPDASAWAAENADRSVINPENRGFAIGMNQGLAVATGELVAFINNDTAFPERWASRIAETLASHPSAGIVTPAVTAAGNPATVRTESGTEVVVFEPFGHLPSGVVYVMRTDQCRALGGWNEGYHLATGEDLDLLFTVWTNDLDVVLDERVLVEHVSAATRKREPAMEKVLKANLEQFLDRWERGDPPPPRLDTCPPDIFGRNRRHAAAAALWLRRLVAARQAVRPQPEPSIPEPEPRRRWMRR